VASDFGSHAFFIPEAAIFCKKYYPPKKNKHTHPRFHKEFTSFYTYRLQDYRMKNRAEPLLEVVCLYEKNYSKTHKKNSDEEETYVHGPCFIATGWQV
jgi:hypothetical protein